MFRATSENRDGRARVREAARNLAAQYATAANHCGDFAVKRKQVLHG
jgi:hypothetical protein